MYSCLISSYATTASFRIPESHTFQETLALPPVSALTGLMGAALGLNFQEAVQFRNSNRVRFGVTGTHQGKTRDLWKYRKIKAGEVLSAVLTREFLTDLTLEIVVTSENKEVAVKIQDAFLDPVYALTAGNSDELLKICGVSKVQKFEEKKAIQFENTILPGDQTENYDSRMDFRQVSILKPIYAPRIYLLPTDFDFFPNGERRVKERKSFTFVDAPIELKNPLNAIDIHGRAVVLI